MVNATWLAFIGYFILSTSDMMVKSLTVMMVKSLTVDYPVTTIVFFNALFSFIPLGLFIWQQGGLASLRPKRLELMVLTGLIGSVGILMLFKGFQLMPMADLYAIAFANPLFATLLAAFLLGEKICRGRGIALMIGFGAILLMIRPGPDLLRQEAMLPLGAALCFSITTLLVRYGSRFNKPPVIMLTSSIVVMVSMLVFGHWIGFVWPRPDHIPQFMLTGFIAGLGQCVNLTALRIGPTIRVVPVMFCQILWGSFYGFVLWHETPHPTTMMLAPIVIGAIFYITRKTAVAATPAIIDAATAETMMETLRHQNIRNQPLQTRATVE